MEEEILNIYLDLAVHLSMKLNEKDRLNAVKWIKIIKECNVTYNGKNLKYEILNFLLHCLRRKVLIAFSNKKIQEINFKASNSKEVLNKQLLIRSPAGLDETSELNNSNSKKQHNARFKTCQQKQNSQKAKSLACGSLPNFERSNNASNNLQYQKSNVNNFNVKHTTRYNKIKCSEEFNRLRNKLIKLKNQVSFSIPSDKLSLSLERRALISNYRNNTPQLANTSQFKSISCPQEVFLRSGSLIRKSLPDISECDQLQNETFPSSKLSQSLERRTPKNNLRFHMQQVSDMEQLENISCPQNIFIRTPPSFRVRLPEISECDQLQNESLPSGNLSLSLRKRTPFKSSSYTPQIFYDEQLEDMSCPQDMLSRTPPSFRRPFPQISECDQLQDESLPSGISFGKRTSIKKSTGYMPHVSYTEKLEDMSCPKEIFSRTPPSFRRAFSEISECDLLQNETLPSMNMSLSLGRKTPIKHSTGIMSHIYDTEQLEDMSCPQEIFSRTPPSYRRPLPEVSECDQLQNESLPPGNMLISFGRRTPIKNSTGYMPHISDMEQLEDMSCPQDIFSKTPQSFRRPLPEISECDQLQNESLPSGNMSISFGRRTPIKYSTGYMPHISDMEQLDDMSCPQDIFTKTPQSFRRPLPEISECDQLQNESLPSGNMSISFGKRTPIKQSTGYMPHVSNTEKLEDMSCPKEIFSRTPPSFRRPFPEISECDLLQNETLPSMNMSLSLGRRTPIKHSIGIMPHISDTEQLEDMSCPQEIFSKTPPSYRRPLPEVSECDQLQNESLPSGNMSISFGGQTPIKNSTGFMPHISDMEQLEDMSCPQDIFTKTPQSFRRPLPEISECDQLQNESLPSGNISISFGRRTPIKHSTGYMPHISDMEQLEDMSCPQEIFTKTPPSFKRPLPEVSECDLLQNETLPSGNMSVSLGRRTPVKHSKGYMPHVSDTEQLEDMSCPQEIFSRTPPSYRRPLPEVSECDQLQNESLPSGNMSISFGRRTPIKHSTGYMPHISDMEQLEDMSCPQDIFTKTPPSFRRPLPEVSECDLLQNETLPSGNMSVSPGRRTPVKHSKGYMPHVSDTEQLEDMSCPQEIFSRTPPSYRRPLPEVSECDQLQNESLPSGNMSISFGRRTPIKHSTGYMPHISDMEQLEDMSCPQEIFTKTPPSFRRPLPEVSECDLLQNETLPSGNMSVSLGRRTPVKHSKGYMPHVSDTEQLEDMSCPQEIFSRTPPSYRRPLPEVSECDQLQNESLPSGNMSISFGRRTPIKHSTGYMPHISDMEQLEDMSCPQDIFTKTPPSFRRPLPEVSECDLLQNETLPSGNMSVSLGRRTPVKHSKGYMPHVSDTEPLEDMSCPQEIFSRTPPSYRRPLPEVSECDQLQNESLPSGNMSISFRRQTPIKHSTGYMPHISDMEQLEDMSCPQDIFTKTPPSFRRPLPEVSECDLLQNETLPSGNMSVFLGRRTPVKHSKGYMPHISDMEQLEDMSCPQDIFSRTPPSFRRPLPEVSECDLLQNETLPSGNMSASLGRRTPVKHSKGYMPHVSDTEQLEDMSCPQEIFSRTPPSYRRPLPEVSECDQLQNESLPSGNMSISFGRRTPIKHSTGYMPHISDMEQLEDMSCPQDIFTKTPPSFRRPLPEVSECDLLQNETLPSGNMSVSLGRRTPVKHSKGYMPHVSDTEQLEDMSCPQEIFSRTPPSYRRPLPEVSECDQLQNESLPSGNMSISFGRRTSIKHSTCNMPHVSDLEQLEDMSCPQDIFSRTPPSFRRPLPEISECDQLQNESLPSGNMSISFGRRTPIKHSTCNMPHVSNMEQLEDMSCPQDIFSRTPPSFRRPLPEISECDQLQNESLPSGNMSISFGRRTPIKHSTSNMPHVSDMEQLEDMSYPQDIFSRTPPSFRRPLPEISECDQLQNESLPSGNISMSFGRRTPIKHSTCNIPHVSDMEQLDDMSCPQDIFTKTPPSFRRPLPEISECDQLQNESLPSGNMSISFGRRTPIKHSTCNMPHVSDTEQLEDMSCPQDIFSRTPPSFRRPLPEISECDQLQNESLPSGNMSISFGRRTPIKHSICNMPHVSDMEQLEDMSCPQDIFTKTPPSYRRPLPEISECDQLQNESLPSGNMSISFGRRTPTKHSTCNMPHVSDMEQLEDMSCPQDIFSRTPPSFRRPLPEISECDQLQNESLPSGNMSISFGRRTPIKHSICNMPHVSDMEQLEDMSCPQDIFSRTPPSFRRPLPEISECDQLQNESLPSGNMSISFGRRTPIKHSTCNMPHLSDMEQLEDMSCPQDIFLRTPPSFRRPLPEISECDQLQNESLPSGNISMSYSRRTPVKHSTCNMPHVSDMEQLEDMSCPQDIFSRTPPSFRRPLPEISECDQLQNESLPSGNMSISFGKRTPIKHSTCNMPHLSDMEQLEDMSCPQDIFSRTPPSFRRPLPEISECDQLQNETLPSGNMSISFGRRTPIKHSTCNMPHLSDMEQLEDMSCPQDIFSRTPPLFRRPLPEISECDQLQNESLPSGNMSISFGRRTPIKHSICNMPHVSDMEQLEDMSCPQDIFSRTPPSFRRPLPEISECDQLQNESLPSGNMSISFGRRTPIKQSTGYMPHITDMEQLEDMSCPKDIFSRTPPSFRRPLPEISECDQLQNESLPSGNISMSFGRRTPIKHSTCNMPHVSDMEQLEDMSCPQDIFSRTPPSFRRPLPEISECDQLQNESLPSGNISMSYSRRTPVKHSTCNMPHVSDMEQLEDMSCPQDIFSRSPPSCRRPLPEISECDQLQNESLPSGNMSISFGRRAPIKYATCNMPHVSDMEQLEDMSCPQDIFSRTPPSFRRPLPEISECDQLQNESLPSGNFSLSSGIRTPIKHSTAYMPHISDMDELEDISFPQEMASRTPPSFRRVLPEISECDNLQNESLPSGNFSLSSGRITGGDQSSCQIPNLSDMEQLEDTSCPEDVFSRTTPSFESRYSEISEWDQLHNESVPPKYLPISLERRSPINHTSSYLSHISGIDKKRSIYNTENIFSGTQKSFRNNFSNPLSVPKKIYNLRGGDEGEVLYSLLNSEPVLGTKMAEEILNIQKFLQVMKGLTSQCGQYVNYCEENVNDEFESLGNNSNVC